MKKSKILLLILSTICLTSCDITFIKPSIPVNSNDTSSNSSSNSSSSSSSNKENDSSSSNSSTSSSSSSNTSSSDSTSSSSSLSYDLSKFNKWTLDEVVDISTYSMNFTSSSSNNVNFTLYRCANSNYLPNEAIFGLLSRTYYQNINSKNGQFYNNSAIKGIKNITITYKNENVNYNPTLYYGVNKYCENKIELPTYVDYDTFSINIDNANFFRLETGDGNMYVSNVDVYYDNQYTSYDSNLLSYQEPSYRINPSTYEGELIDGVSSIDMPVSTKLIDGKYYVTETKTYTYYSYDYISNNKSLVQIASLTDPIDVANYFIAFKTYPSNYVTSKNMRSCKNLFGKNARRVSSYSITDGYSTSVPYYKGSTFMYYECDVALDEDEYYSGNRGSGRVVIWVNGFDSDGYDNNPVAVYTDDHYATFCEYLNNGLFSMPFCADSKLSFASIFKWTNILTVEKN